MSEPVRIHRVIVGIEFEADVEKALGILEDLRALLYTTRAQRGLTVNCQVVMRPRTAAPLTPELQAAVSRLESGEQQ